MPFLVFGTSNNTSGVYGTVAVIFLFQGAYSIGWTPVLYLYPPEVLNYPIRANGLGIFSVALNATACVLFFFISVSHYLILTCLVVPLILFVF